MNRPDAEQLAEQMNAAAPANVTYTVCETQGPGRGGCYVRRNVHRTAEQAAEEIERFVRQAKYAGADPEQVRRELQAA